MRKILFAFIGLLLGVILFLPKDSIFFAGEKYIKQYDVFLNFQNINSSILSLELYNVKVYLHGIDDIKIKKISFISLFFVNKLFLKNITLLDNRADVILNYNILSPFTISINGSSNLGKLQGDINLKTNKLKIYILNLKNRSFQSFLKKDKKGYFYEQSF